MYNRFVLERRSPTPKRLCRRFNQRKGRRLPPAPLQRRTELLAKFRRMMLMGEWIVVTTASKNSSRSIIAASS
jgi:hypothetical protein